VVAPSPFLTIALPVKDGELALERTLEQVMEAATRLGRPFEILAVDDGSTDGSHAILDRFAGAHGELTVLTHPGNRGKGAALKTAAVASRGEVLLTLDADATYQLDGLEDFIQALEEGHEAAIGNRRDERTQFVLNTRDFAYVGRRHAVGALFGWLARGITGVRVADCQAGYKCYRGDVARSLFPQVDADRFAFDIEILALLNHHGHRVAELPVTYVYRHQPSTVKLFRDGFRMFRRLTQVRAKLKRLRRSGDSSGRA
jgi:dolichyl-phosphate beta-glucosyltransferase